MSIESAQEIARDNFATWNNALQTGEPATVASLYAENASFLPTVETIKNGREGAAEYFVHFLTKNPFGSITEDTVQQVDDDVIVHSGLYDFKVGPEDDRSVVHARFTFIWGRTSDGWEILHHHSSVQPQ